MPFKNVYPCPSFAGLPSAPRGNLANQITGQWFAVGELNRAFAGFVSLQPVCKGFHRRWAGIQADVLFECRKLDEVPFFPVRWHTP